MPRIKNENEIIVSKEVIEYMKDDNTKIVAKCIVDYLTK
jgi:hypothetical protein